MSNSLTVIPGTSGTVSVVENALPEPTKYALREMLVAFPSQNVSADERSIQLGTYRDAVLGFEQELVVHVVKWLRFHNPRNTPTYTQPPTAQDVHVAIRNRRNDWARQAAEYFFGALGHDNRGRRRWKRTRETLPDCSRALAEKLACELCQPKEHDALIERMTDEAFAELPTALFDAETRTQHTTHRAHLAYLREMDDDTWHIRRALLMHDRSLRMTSCEEGAPDLTEESLTAKTAELLAEFRAGLSPTEASFGSHAVRSFITERGFASSDVSQLCSEDLRCIPWHQLHGLPPPVANKAVAEIINLTARKMES